MLSRSLKLILLLFSFLSISLNAEEEIRKSFIDEVFKEKIKTVSTFKIAVLPIQNMTMYPNLPYYFRQHINDILSMQGYAVIDKEILDKALMDVGIQKADHLRLLSFDKLAQMTSADAILSGIIETANVQDAAVYSGFAFTASLKLQLRNGDTVWYDLSERVAKRRLAFDPFNIVFNILANRESDKHIKAIKAVAQNLLKDFPKGPNEVVVDDLLGQAIELK